jgi:hypothetical protein
MKALIIYDSIGSALKTSNSLRNAAHGADIRVTWKISIWRASLLRFRSVADEALKESTDADLIVFAGCRTGSLAPWLREWLERWVANRLVKHATLALMDDKSPGPSRPVKTSELWQFAERHNLEFIVGDDNAPENEYASPSMDTAGCGQAANPLIRETNRRSSISRSPPPSNP